MYVLLLLLLLLLLLFFRYFVLDSGYLNYFVDQQEVPPYGKDRKGQLCLAGYRIVHAGNKGIIMCFFYLH